MIAKPNYSTSPMYSICPAAAGGERSESCRKYLAKGLAGVVPAPLLDAPEGRGLVRVNVAGLEPGELRLLLLTRPHVPLSLAADYFAHCLMATCAQ